MSGWINKEICLYIHVYSDSISSKTDSPLLSDYEDEQQIEFMEKDLAEISDYFSSNPNSPRTTPVPSTARQPTPVPSVPSQSIFVIQDPYNESDSSSANHIVMLIPDSPIQIGATNTDDIVFSPTEYTPLRPTKKRTTKRDVHLAEFKSVSKEMNLHLKKSNELFEDSNSIVIVDVKKHRDGPTITTKGFF